MTVWILVLAVSFAGLALSLQILQVAAARHKSGILFILFILKAGFVSSRQHLLKWLTAKSFLFLTSCFYTLSSNDLYTNKVRPAPAKHSRSKKKKIKIRALVYLFQVLHVLKFFTVARDFLDCQGKLLTSILGVIRLICITVSTSSS